jgi:hypothetical protein
MMDLHPLSFADWLDRVRWLVRIVFLMVLMTSLGSGCQNALSEFANRESDPALIFEAEKRMNGREWAKALELLDKVSTSGRTRKYLQTKAAAHAGLCGLELVSLVQDIGNGVGGPAVVPMMLSIYKGNGSVQLQACKDAEAQIIAISAGVAGRTVDENIMMLLIGMAKIGTIMSADDNIDANDDGTKDATLSSCASLTDSDISHFGWSFVNVVNSLEAVIAAGVQLDGFGNVSSVKATLIGFNSALASLFNKDNPADSADAFTQIEKQALAGLVRSNDTGFGFNEDTFTNAAASAGTASCFP